MSDTQTDRVVVLLPPDIHEALLLEAAMRGRKHTMGSVITDLVRAHLAETLEQVHRRPERQDARGKKGGRS